MTPARDPVLDPVLFDGATCARLVHGTALPLAVLRRRIAAAITGAPGDALGGAEIMLVLHAAGALEPDEHAAVERALRACPVLRGPHEAYRRQIAELCTRSLRACAPPPSVWQRLVRSIEADEAAAAAAAPAPDDPALS